MVCFVSLDGQVKLWDMRGPPLPIQTWNIQPQGLSAFDTHPMAGVFAALVQSHPHFFLTSPLRIIFSSSAISPSNWRAQKIVVNSLNRRESLSSFHIQTGLSFAPLKTLPSRFIPRLSSLRFHPKEMLCGLGQPDGTSKSFGNSLRT
jgi:regulator-associated protein of mTOR